MDPLSKFIVTDPPSIDNASPTENAESKSDTGSSDY